MRKPQWRAAKCCAAPAWRRRVWIFRGSLVLDSSFQRGSDHAARPAHAEAIEPAQDERFGMRILLVVLSAVMAIMLGKTAAAEEAKTPPVRAAATAEASVPKLDCARPQLPEKLPTAAEQAGSLTTQVN